MSKWDGLAGRLKQAIVEAGFVNAKGNADIQRFALAHGWIPNYVYRWANGSNAPDQDNARRLGKALNISPAWLFFGDEVPKEPLQRRAKRKIVALVVAALSIGSGLPDVAHANTPTYGHQPESRRIMSRFWLHRLYRWCVVKVATLPLGRGFPDLTRAASLA